jgi:hypothetical protein
MVSNSRIVWRFGLMPFGRTVINVPEGARPLHVGLHDRGICLWMLCDPDALRTERTILTVGTGTPITLADSASHLGTVVDEGGYVVHAFDLGEGVQYAAPL